MPHPKDIFKRTELQSPNRSSNSVSHVGFSHWSVPHILVHLNREFPYFLHSIKQVSKKTLLVQRWIDADLNNIACCCRQQPSLAQWQTRSSSGDKVGFEWLEGPNVIDFELFIHAWCHHITAKMGEQDSRLQHVGQRGGAHNRHCASASFLILLCCSGLDSHMPVLIASCKCWCRETAPALRPNWRMWSFWVTHLPALSTATERTAPWWQSIFTRASFWLGDQSVTVPLWWPKWMTALWGFWHIASSRPVLVQIAATSFPTETSRYCRKLVAL